MCCFHISTACLLVSGIETPTSRYFTSEPFEVNRFLSHSDSYNGFIFFWNSRFSNSHLSFLNLPDNLLMTSSTLWIVGMINKEGGLSN